MNVRNRGSNALGAMCRYRIKKGAWRIGVVVRAIIGQSPADKICSRATNCQQKVIDRQCGDRRRTVGFFFLEP